MHKSRVLLAAISLGLCTQWAVAAPTVPERLVKVDKLGGQTADEAGRGGHDHGRGHP